MPPLLNEDDSSENEIPFKDPKNADDKDDGDDSGADSEEYVIEKIVAHDWNDDGELVFEVKWENWPDDSNTFEPEDNLATATEALKDYYARIGGKPVPPDDVGKKSKKRGPKKGKRKTLSTGGAVGSAKGKKKQRLNGDSASASPDVFVPKRVVNKYPPHGNWEPYVTEISTIERHNDPTTGKDTMQVLIVWENGQKTRHDLKTAHSTIPKKMCEFYAEHLVFRDKDGAAAFSNTEEPDRESSMGLVKKGMTKADQEEARAGSDVEMKTANVVEEQAVEAAEG